MSVEDAHWLAQPVGVIDGPAMDEARFHLPELEPQTITAYTAPPDTSTFLPFRVPGIERSATPPPHRPGSRASRTSEENPPPAYSARPTACKAHCPPGHVCT